jgi:hypothetical protein
MGRAGERLMTLSLILEHPDVGMVTPPFVQGTIEYQLDRYPRWRLMAELRPDANAVHLWQSPYGTRGYVLRPDGSLLYSGPVFTSSVARPDGRWVLQGADDSLLLRQWKTSNTPGQFLPGTTLDLPGFINALAARAGVTLKVAGSGGLVDVTVLDIAASQGWALVEEQLIANNLDVYPQGDGTLLVTANAAMKPTPDHTVEVGAHGTITGYRVDMTRVYNRVILTHEATKEGETDRHYIDGVWEDTATASGSQKIGPSVYTRTLRVGGDWWDDPSGHQSAANQNAAAVAQAVRGYARTIALDIVPDYSIAPGDTIEVTISTGTTDRFLVMGVRWPLEPGAVHIDARNPDPAWPGSTFFEEVADARQHTQ